MKVRRNSDVPNKLMHPIKSRFIVDLQPIDYCTRSFRKYPNSKEKLHLEVMDT